MGWSLIGNEKAVSAVAGAVAAGSWSHAYLFAGPEGTGKATLARQFAQAVNCVAPQPPCGECSHCRRIAASAHSDVFTLTVEATTEGPQHKAIAVEQVREVERVTALSPFEGSCRVVIIDPADAMTTGAQNAFLKTLEEPPSHVVFILVATHPERLLETVVSRCRRIDFRLAPRPAIERGLAERGVDAAQAALLAGPARGRPGRAIALAEQPEMAERRQQAVEEARSLPRLPIAGRMELAERLAEDFRRDREAVLWLLGEWQEWWRDVLLVQSGASDGVTGLDMLDLLRQDAAAYATAEVRAFAHAIREARRQLQENVQARLSLESLLLKAPAAGGGAVTAGSGRGASRHTSRLYHFLLHPRTRASQERNSQVGDIWGPPSRGAFFSAMEESGGFFA